MTVVTNPPSERPTPLGTPAPNRRDADGGTNPLKQRRVPVSRQRNHPVRAPRRDRARELVRSGHDVALWWRLAALVIIVGALLIPRWLEVDRLVTPDEPIWLARSANFYQALSSGDLQYTYQFAHPGVPVMWLGAVAFRVVAPDYPALAGEQISQRQNRVAGVLEEQGRDPLEIMVAARKALILAATLIGAVAYWIALRLYGFWEITLGFLLLALEPFSIGLTRLLHVDGLASMFMLLAVIAGLSYLYRGSRRRDLAVSAIAAGLAVLTRSQMGFLAVWFSVMAVTAAFGWPPRWLGADRFRTQIVRPVLFWGLGSLATVILFWPALWVDPIGALGGVLDFVETAALEGHERAIYFVGFVYEGDPGWRFYPTSFLWRATPATVVGLAAAGFVLIRARKWRIPRPQIGIILGLALAATGYLLLMSVAAKKFDRYILPIFPILALVAGWGIIHCVRRIARLLPGPRWAALAVSAGLALTIQLSGVTASAPYYLSYFNPMLGGAKSAPSAMMVGWGEGMDQVAAYVNGLPNSEELVVATEAWRSPMSYFLDGKAQFASYVGDGPGLYRWANSDFYLLYITPLHRRGVPEIYLAELEQKEPVLTVTLNGLDYAWLYDIRDDPVPFYQEVAPSGMIDWIGAGRMVAAGRTSEIGDTLGSVITETLYFDSLDSGVIDGDRELRLEIVLRDPEGIVIDRDDGPFALETPGRHGLWKIERTVTIPHDADPGAYRVRMRLYDGSTGESLTGFNYQLGVLLGDTVGIDTFRVWETEIQADAIGNE
jgi:hypothetical protein